MRRRPLLDGVALSTLGFCAGLLGATLESEAWQIAALVAVALLFLAAIFASHR
jgi:hypothetical protein